MKRREFISLLGGAAMAMPLAAHAQQPGRIYRLGVILPSGRQTPPIEAFFDELRLNGFIEGRNLEVLPGGLEIRNEQMPAHAAAMVRAAPDVIISGGVFATRAVQQVNTSVPHVATSNDMVADGFVTSLARPGGNTTGFSLLAPELDGKRQDLLIEAVPGVRKLGLLADANTTPAAHVQKLQEAARGRGIEAAAYTVTGPDGIAPAMQNAKADGAMALNVLTSPMFGAYPNRGIVTERATALRLPAIYEWPEMAEEGGFAAYGPRFSTFFRQYARIVVRVLRGTKPADIPVEQPTRFELVINLKTAKAIGHEIPAGLVLRADKLVE